MKCKGTIPRTLPALRAFLARHKLRRGRVAKFYGPKGCRPQWIGDVLNEQVPVSGHVLELIRCAIGRLLEEREAAAAGKASQMRGRNRKGDVESSLPSERRSHGDGRKCQT